MLFRKLITPLRLPVLRNHTRSASILSALNSSPVLVSSNRDIYTNLALEHWLYTNLRFDRDDSTKQSKTTNLKHPVVLIWTDEPCIVIGRHQNPWLETTLGLVNRLGIKLARRHSGGGCVYHDESNINISIIGDRRVFDNRQENLKFLAKILGDKYGIGCEPNKRHDLIHSSTGHKMSGSAAKLGRFNSYHHFTLLVDTDIEVMQSVIRQKQQDFISTNSSVSTRSKVINLSELKPDLNVQQVLSDLAQAYGKHYKSSEQVEVRTEDSKVEVDRDELESLNNYTEELMSWKWRYGMTPKFKLERFVSFLVQGEKRDVTFRVHVNRGLFESFEIDCDLDDIRGLASKFDSLIGTSFEYKDAMVRVAKMLQVGEVSSSCPSASTGSATIAGREQIFATYLLQMIHESNFHRLNQGAASSSA